MKELPSQPIAQGRTAEIYEWDTHRILKLYRDWCPSDWVDHEAQTARAVYEAGIPSPAPGEIVEVNGRRGLIYQRLVGISMLQDMNTYPWRLVRHARSLAELQAKINQQTVAGLPYYKDRLRFDINGTQYLTDALKSKVLLMLEALPNSENLCHGDFHPGNVIIAEQGPIVIDWMTACAGSQWADVSRTSLLLSIGPKGASNQISPIIHMMIHLFHRTFLNRYRALTSPIGNALKRWEVVMAAARLSENIAPERQALIELVKQAEVQGVDPFQNDRPGRTSRNN